jgi:branched-chain amino acid transport system permease protein
VTSVSERAKHLRSSPNAWLVPVVIVLGLLYPFLEDSLASLPLIGDFMPTTGTVVVMIAFTMMAVGLNIVVGYCGLLDLGYVAFYAVGAYTAGWFASQQFEQVTFHFGSVGLPHSVPGIHISMWLILPLAGLLTMLAGILIGLPTLRLRGDYLAIVTLGFGEIVPQFVRNADNLGGFDLTHGTYGITPIDSVGFPLLSSIGLPDNFQTSDHRERWYYLIAFLLLLFTVFCSVRLRDSRLGRAWIAIREDETAAAAMGVPLMRTKTWAYALGAFFGGVAGAYYASFKSGAFPADFYFNISVFLLCMVILGGMGSIWGVTVGGMILAYLNFSGLSTIGSKIQDAGIDFDPTKYQFGIYGIIIVLMMLFRPAGLIPERRHKVEFEEGVHDTPFYDVQTEGVLTDRDPSDD